MLSVQNISFSYGSTEILSRISFNILPGRLTALLGVNGAGKTTLLKCCNRILSPALGAVYMGGVDIAAMTLREIAASIGYVPQRGADVDISVFEMILLGRHPHSFWGPTRGDEKIVEDILMLLGMERFALRSFRTLSGGEVQKILIGRAIAQDPKILLLDEPTSSLDLNNQAMIMNLLKHLAAEHGLGIFVIIHDINLALQHCDEILLLKDKRIQWAGNPRDVNRDIVNSIYDVQAEMVEVKGRPVFII